MRNLPSEYRGRFAPSPSGSLHFGSLIAAVASYLDAKAHQGKWLLRIEDIDQARVQTGAIQSILQILEGYGFAWDETILYQSQRFKHYQKTLDDLIYQQQSYPCSCTKKIIKQTAKLGQYGWIYVGTCRQSMANPQAQQYAYRLKCNDLTISFEDKLKGKQTQKILSEVGDFILKRSDGVFAYQLAVVIDDAYQHISHIVRGEDLLDNTARQIYLQQLLKLSTPEYLHFPIAKDKTGRKLSKSNQAPEIKIADKLENIHQALQFLGQQPPAITDFEHIDDLWKWAIIHWNRNKIGTTL